VPPEQGLLLFVRLLAETGAAGKVAVPVTTTAHVDRLVEGTELEIMRTRASLAELTRTASEDGVVFAGAATAGYVFPAFLPAYDSVASLAKLVELLARSGRPLSELVDELPAPALVHEEVPCAWAVKGTVMRVLTERLKDRETDILDGIKFFDERGWAQALPDPDEPLVHVYAEGETEDVSHELAAELRGLVEEAMQGERAAERTETTIAG
jgi:mannose-1-phosphate guanylyltransferase/phosphomannomutase